MSRKKLALTLIITTLPVISFADITLVNNTDLYGTAALSMSPCSSRAGDRGIIPPHGTLTVPQSILNSFCSLWSCDAHIYATKDCSGKEMATITVNSSDGITNIQNNVSDQYTITGGGMSIQIDPVANGFFGWLKSLFK